MSENCSGNCESCGKTCGDRSAPQSFLAPQNPKSNVRKVIAVASGKGGVGKSLVATLLAAAFARAGKKTAILDADITGPSIPASLGIDQEIQGTEHELVPATSRGGIKVMSLNLLLEDPASPVVWRGPVIAGVVKQFWSDVAWGDVDVMVVDMPPGTGDVPLTVFQSLHVDGAVIVTTPQQLVGQIVGKAVKMAGMMDIPVLGIVENMAYFKCPNCGAEHSIYGKGGTDDFAQRHGIDEVCRIPIDPAVSAAVDAGRAEEIRIAAMDDFARRILDKVQGGGAA
ncbi:MAG: Mrp/NBP35 family ATP-binding protein [Kiritimatiellae bacterium]|nr:Mrp/NBP35 family ATP-binding protein [Kiritimatiellia bacterium]